MLFRSLWGTMQGCKRSKRMSKFKMGLLKPQSGSVEMGMEQGGLGRVGHMEFRKQN